MPQLIIERSTVVSLRRRARLLERMADYLPTEVMAAEVASRLAREIVEEVDHLEARLYIFGDDFAMLRETCDVVI